MLSLQLKFLCYNFKLQFLNINSLNSRREYSDIIVYFEVINTLYNVGLLYGVEIYNNTSRSESWKKLWSNIILNNRTHNLKSSYFMKLEFHHYLNMKLILNSYQYSQVKFTNYFQCQSLNSIKCIPKLF